MLCDSRLSVCASRLAALAFFASASAGAAGQDYAVITIDPIAGYFSQASGINNLGQVCGESGIEEDSFSARGQDARGRARKVDLGTLDRCCSDAFAINDAGMVVGESYTDRIGYNQAFAWVDGVMTNLGTLGGDGSIAWSLNDLGQIVGQSEFELGNAYDLPVLWDDGKIIELGSLGGRYGRAFDINNVGEIVGDSWVSDEGPIRAFLWRDGEMTDLGALGGEESIALHLNEQGMIVGGAETDLFDNQVHACVWIDGVIRDIDDDPDMDLGSAALAINDRGEIAGQYYSNDVERNYLALWPSVDEPSINITAETPPRFRWTFTYIFDMNNHGQIVTEVVGGPYAWRAAILTPFTAEFDLDPIEPAAAGQVNTLRATGLEPDERVTFVYGRYGGGAYIEGCDVLDAVGQIDEPRVIGTTRADAAGVARLEVFVNDDAADRGPILFQATTGDSSCKVSNLREATFE